VSGSYFKNKTKILQKYQKQVTICRRINEHSLQSKKIRDEVGMFSLQSERASASSFARQKEMIELKLKQTELRL